MIKLPSQALAEMNSIVSDFDNKVIDKKLAVNCLRNLHYFTCKLAGGSRTAMIIRDKYQSIANNGYSIVNFKQ